MMVSTVGPPSQVRSRASPGARNTERGPRNHIMCLSTIRHPGKCQRTTCVSHGVCSSTASSHGPGKAPASASTGNARTPSPLANNSAGPASAPERGRRLAHRLAARSSRVLEESGDIRHRLVAQVNAGELDLATQSGRAVARSVGAWAWFELDGRTAGFIDVWQGVEEVTICGPIKTHVGSQR
jgi:hypothetical protein